MNESQAWRRGFAADLRHLCCRSGVIWRPRRPASGPASLSRGMLADRLAEDSRRSSEARGIAQRVGPSGARAMLHTCS